MKKGDAVLCWGRWMGTVKTVGDYNFLVQFSAGQIYSEPSEIWVDQEYVEPF